MKFFLSFISIIIFSGVCLSQPQATPSLYFSIDTGRGTLKAFNDGSVTETRDSKAVTRRLSASQMRKVEEIIAARPCQYGMPRSDSAHPQIADHDCSVGWAGAGFGLAEVKVNLHYKDGQTGVFPVYFLCTNLSGRAKDRTKDIHQNYLSPSWQRFLRELSKAAGAGKFLKHLDCESYWTTPMEPR